MKRRFVIAVEGLSEVEEAAFIRYLNEGAKVGWWHHIGGFWLIVDSFNLVDVLGLREALKALKPGVNPLLIMEIHDDITWAGVNRAGSTTSFDWLSREWTGG